MLAFGAAKIPLFVGIGSKAICSYWRNVYKEDLLEKGPLSAEDAPSGFPFQAVAAPSLSQGGVRCLAVSAVAVSQLFLP